VKGAEGAEVFGDISISINTLPFRTHNLRQRAQIGFGFFDIFSLVPLLSLDRTMEPAENVKHDPRIHGGQLTIR
jgi:hypothetical protein